MHKDQSYASVSVIIPVRNEENHIESCISNLLDTTYPLSKIEIIVIDGESSDNTREVIKHLQEQGLNLKLFSNPKKTPYAGLNIGLKHSKGDIILRLDARSICPRDYIKACIDTLIKTNADNVGGVQRPIGMTPTQEAIAIAMTHPFGVGNAQFRIGKKSGYVDTVYLGCYKRVIFDQIGYFDEDGPVISEDSSMNQRIIKNGGKVYLNKDIIVSYYTKDNFKNFWRQYFVYGGARAHSFLKYKKFTSIRQLIPLSFLSILFILFLFSFIEKTFLYFLISLCCIYIFLDILISLFLSINKNKWYLLPRLFVAFPCMHFAWGLGFFRRLVEGSKPGRHWRKF